MAPNPMGPEGLVVDLASGLLERAGVQGVQGGVQRVCATVRREGHGAGGVDQRRGPRARGRNKAAEHLEGKTGSEDRARQMAPEA